MTMSKGLPSRFVIENGKFSLVDGVEKSRDNIWFYCVFDKFRVYTSNFGSNFISLVQKPVSYLLANQTLILGSLAQKIQKYCPGVTVKSLDIGYTSMERKDLSLYIEYTSEQENKTKIQDVTFV